MSHKSSPVWQQFWHRIASWLRGLFHRLRSSWNKGRNFANSRRDLLRGIGSGALTLPLTLPLTLGLAAAPFALARLLAPPETPKKRRGLRPLVRLPGAIKEAQAFAAACIGCGLCGEVCPPKCIRFHRRDGGLLANTPFIDPEEKACTLCGKCMQVCPTEALTVVAREKVDMGLAQIDRTACYPWVDRGVCGACVSICPLGSRAMRFERFNQYRPVVEKGCVGCGLCVEVCPHPSVPIWITDRDRGSVAKHRI